MINDKLSKHIGRIAVVSGVMAGAIYLLMINVTLANIEAISGHVPFDMRPFGYGPPEATALLEALGVEGRAYYLSRQIVLDTLYPALLALTLIATNCWFAQSLPDRKLVNFGIAASIGSALFDYAENLGIVVMIRSGPEVSGTLVYAASTATIAKSAFTTLAVLMTLLIGFTWARRSRSGPSPKAG